MRAVDEVIAAWERLLDVSQRLHRSDRRELNPGAGAR